MVGSREWKDFQGPISASQFIHSFIISNSEHLLVLTKGLTVGDISFKKQKKIDKTPCHMAQRIILTESYDGNLFIYFYKNFVVL